MSVSSLSLRMDPGRMSRSCAGAAPACVTMKAPGFTSCSNQNGGKNTHSDGCIVAPLPDGLQLDVEVVCAALLDERDLGGLRGRQLAPDRQL